MSLRRVAVLLEREIVRGPKNFMFIFVIIVPVVLSVLVNLVFGTYFAGKPTLGVADLGDSGFVDRAEQVESIRLEQYTSVEALKSAVTRGALDLGLVLPDGLDTSLMQGSAVQLTGYIWGESLMRDRAILGTTVIGLLREMVGQEPPVEIVTSSVGEVVSVPWEDRLLPFIVMITILIGGMMIPATSLVDEKQKHTLRALVTTPTTVNDVLAAKGLLGVLLSIVMGVLILFINQAFGTQPALLVLLTVLGALMAAGIGVLLGALVKDIDTLFATIKGIGILLYAPALVYLFPEIPHWIGRIFPTYYMIAPIVEVTQGGAGWSDIAPDVAILLALIVLLMVVAALAGRRMQTREAG